MTAKARAFAGIRWTTAHTPSAAAWAVASGLLIGPLLDGDVTVARGAMAEGAMRFSLGLGAMVGLMLMVGLLRATRARPRANEASGPAAARAPYRAKDCDRNHLGWRFLSIRPPRASRLPSPQSDSDLGSRWSARERPVEPSLGRRSSATRA